MDLTLFNAILNHANVASADNFPGQKAILKTGIWVESKAVDHYAELLKNVDWDEDTRAVVEKDQADEHGHIARWRAMLENM